LNADGGGGGADAGGVVFTTHPAAAKIDSVVKRSVLGMDELFRAGTAHLPDGFLIFALRVL
jgi:hypothetical protein